MRHGLLISLILILLSSLSCSVNVLSTFADKTTNDAYYVDAQAKINAGDYDGALASIAKMTNQTETPVVMLKASAYGGKCGLDYIDFALNFANNSINLMAFVLSEMRSPTSDRIDACIAGQNLVTGLGTAAQRTSDQNIFMALLSLAKLGVILGYYSDADDDGVADVSGDRCVYGATSRPTAPVSEDFFESDLRELGTGLTIAYQSLKAVSSTINLGSSTTSSLDTICTLLNDACDITDPSLFSPLQLQALRSLVNETSAIGVGPCTVNGGSGNVTDCGCTNP
jgi:hypothetical protein